MLAAEHAMRPSACHMTLHAQSVGSSLGEGRRAAPAEGLPGAQVRGAASRPGASNTEQGPGNGRRRQGHPGPWTKDTSFPGPLQASHRLQLKDQSVPPQLRHADRTCPGSRP